MATNDGTAATTMSTPDPLKSSEQLVAALVMLVAQGYLLLDPTGLPDGLQAALQAGILAIWTVVSLVHASLVRKGRVPIAVAQLEQSNPYTVSDQTQELWDKLNTAIDRAEAGPEEVAYEPFPQPSVLSEAMDDMPTSEQREFAEALDPHDYGSDVGLEEDES